MSFPTTRALVEALRSREISAVELTRAACERIEAHDRRINAVVVRDFERALVAAAAADKALARGEQRPLLGIPMTVKESFNVAGLSTTWGIPGPASAPAQSDAVAVRRLKSAGAVILGKTNVPTNLGDLQTANPLYGLTRNPWNADRTAGGSSGGSAAALAAGYVSLELGSDLAGSLRSPAHCCGIFAHKPTYDLVPIRGHAPPGTPELSVSPAMDLAVVGPMARAAGDLTLALGILAGPDDLQAVGYSVSLPPPRHSRLSEFTVLLLDEHPLLPLSGEVRTALQRFADALRRMGCTVASSSPLLPDLSAVADTFTQLLMSSIGAGLPDGAYRGLSERVAQRPSRADDRESMRLRALVSSHRDWVLADRRRAAMSHQWNQFFRTCDVIVCPILPTTAFPHDDREVAQRSIDIDGRTVPFAGLGIWASVASVCGLPATAMPIGTGESGLPIGIQIIGPYLGDRSTLAFAELAERELGGFVPPPGYD